MLPVAARRIEQTDAHVVIDLLQIQPFAPNNERYTFFSTPSNALAEVDGATRRVARGHDGRPAHAVDECRWGVGLQPVDFGAGEDVRMWHATFFDHVVDERCLLVAADGALLLLHHGDVEVSEEEHATELATLFVDR